jgi:hypothetical protein
MREGRGFEAGGEREESSGRSKIDGIMTMIFCIDE